jgi:DNA-directed RNA polymerase sigma subunit (sigma70/sigma32)
MDYERFMEEVRSREKDMVELRRKGMTLQQIGDRYQITAERVRQIVTRTKKARGKDPAIKKTSGGNSLTEAWATKLF